MELKALTLWQPWASLVALGEKKYETRSWSTEYRGYLAIHAAVRKPEGFTAAADVLGHKHGIAKWSDLPRGFVVAVVRLVDVIPTTFNHDFVEALPAQERAFGDFRSGRYAWKLEDLMRLREPIPARGYQGLWIWNAPEGFLANLEPAADTE